MNNNNITTTKNYRVAKFLFFFVILLGGVNSLFMLILSLYKGSSEAFFFGFASICISAVVFLLFKDKYAV